MIVDFIIFTHLLINSGVLCIAQNSCQNRYAILLEALAPYSRCTPGTFFRRLLLWIRQNRIAIAPEMDDELNLLALDPSTEACRYATAFAAFPAATPAERFYTLLIGFTLDAYERILKKADDENMGQLTALSDHTRLLVCLRRIFCMEVATPTGIEGCPVIVCSVKAAVSILYSHLKDKHKAGTFEVYPLCNARKALAEIPAMQELPPEVADAFMALYDRLANDRPVPAQKEKNVILPDTLQQEGMQQPSYSMQDIIPEVLILQEEIHNCYAAMAKMSQLTKAPAPPGREEADRLVDSAEARMLLNVSKSTLCRMRKKKELPFYVIGQKINYKLSDIRNYINRKKGNPEADAPGSEQDRYNPT